VGRGKDDEGEDRAVGGRKGIKGVVGKEGVVVKVVGGEGVGAEKGVNSQEPQGAKVDVVDMAKVHIP